MSTEYEKNQRIATWIRAGAADATYDGGGSPNGPGDAYFHEDEIYWGVFVVDASDTRPVAMFVDEKAANRFANHLEDLNSLENGNTEYGVSPCVCDLAHRDNGEVPK